MTRILTVPEYLQLEKEELNWIIPGLLAKPSKTLIVGGPKAGKSFLALALALAIANGSTVFGRPAKKSKVLLLQFDTSHGIWAEMISGVADEGHDITGTLYHVHPHDMPHPPNILLPSMQDFVRRVLDTCEPDVVILDVFRKIHTAGENDSQQMAVVDHVIEMLFHAVAFILLHHSKKPNFDQPEMDPITASRGSSHIASIADFVWYLTTKKLMIVPRMDAPLEYGMKRLPSGLWSLDGMSEEDDVRTKLVAICERYPGSTKNAVFDRERDNIISLGVSRAKYYRLLEDVFTGGIPTTS